MIPLLRSGRALLLKEVHHHALAFAFVAAWSGLMVPLALATAFAGGGTSFVASGVGLAYYYGPIVVLLVVRRLVIQEYEDGTVRFLDALPAPAWLQFAVKVAVGWVTVVGITLASAAPVLALAALRELVTAGWYLQLAFAIVLYQTGWLALTFAVALTGRFRHWIWIALFVLGGVALDGEWQLGTWHAALGLPADATRHEVPWAGFAVTAAWTVALAAVAATLATFQGGALPAAAFRSGSTRERVTGAAWVLALYLVVEVWGETGAGTLVGWEVVPEAQPGVRALGAVGSWPEAARDALDALEAVAPLDPPTTLILAADHADPAAGPGPGVRRDRFDRDRAMLRVRGEPTVADRARLVDAVVDQRSAGLAEHALDRGFAVDGLGLYVAERAGERALAEKRAAVAVQHGLRAADLEDWAALRDRFGADLAAGVGAVGLDVLARLGSREAVGAWVGAWILPVLPETTLAPLRLGRVGDEVAGVDRAALHRAWWEALEAAQEARGWQVTHVAPLVAALSVEQHTSAFDVAWELDAEPPVGVELVVELLDPIRGRAMRFEDDHRVLRREVRSARGRAPTWFRPDDHVRVHLRRWEPSIEGWLQGPTEELAR